MTTGWVRAYARENSAVNSRSAYSKRQARAAFRAGFTTPLKASASDSAATLVDLPWGAEVDLNGPVTANGWRAVTADGQAGFLEASHVVELGFVARRSGSTKSAFQSRLTYEDSSGKSHTKYLLWGDPVQITKRGPNVCEVRARGYTGKMATEDITDNPLLEIYFIDVGQGDGVLVRTPDGRHMMIDGGLRRTDQQTGKNAADYVDWKFFMDYGHHVIRLDSMMASHSDIDHYGGLHDLVRDTSLAERELDCTAVEIDTVHHPGLSRWPKAAGQTDGLGALSNGAFVDLLDDRASVEAGLAGMSVVRSPWWQFLRDLAKHDAGMTFARAIATREGVRAGDPPPLLWDTRAECACEVLAPVSRDEGGLPALPDLGDTGKNSNGHSIALRLVYKKARILLAGDLNTKAMHWLQECYDDRMSLFTCDVAKACHHGSDDIAYSFLESVNAAATVISSGDAEGYAHPRPEIVAASACSGHKEVDRVKDRLKTPLVYMTEIERSVTLGAVNRIDVEGLPDGSGGTLTVATPARPMDEIPSRGILNPDEVRALRRQTTAEKNAAVTAAKARDGADFAAKAAAFEAFDARIRMNLTVPLGPVDEETATKSIWRGRMMQKTHYGLVNVRTDGETIMCATMDETGDDWIIHNFPARFTDRGL